MKNVNNFTLNGLAAIIDALGEEAAAALAVKGQGVTVKDGHLTIGQNEAFRNRFLVNVPASEREDTITRILSGEIEVTVKLKEAIWLLFDKNGRFKPFEGTKAAVTDFNQNYAPKAPKLDAAWFAQALKRVELYYAKEFYDVKLVWPTAKEFEDRVNDAIAKVSTDNRTANAVKSGVFAWCLPGGLEDLKHGRIIDRIVRVAENLYKKTYKVNSWPFTIQRQEGLAKTAEIINGTRYERILQTVSAGQPVVGISVPALGGFSIDAARETFTGHKMSPTIPDFLSLGGGIDLVAMIVMNVEETLDSERIPVWCASAMHWPLSGSLRFDAYSVDASFDRFRHLANAKGHRVSVVSCLG